MLRLVEASLLLCCDLGTADCLLDAASVGDGEYFDYGVGEGGMGS